MMFFYTVLRSFNGRREKLCGVLSPTRYPAGLLLGKIFFKKIKFSLAKIYLL